MFNIGKKFFFLYKYKYVCVCFEPEFFLLTNPLFVFVFFSGPKKTMVRIRQTMNETRIRKDRLSTILLLLRSFETSNFAFLVSFECGGESISVSFFLFLLYNNKQIHYELNTKDKENIFSFVFIYEKQQMSHVDHLDRYV